MSSGRVDFEQVNDKEIEIINPMNAFVDSIINAIDIESMKQANLPGPDRCLIMARNALQTVLISARW